MKGAIRSHRYDLQYIIYTLALHRYLRLRMPNYHYDQHIGGSFYLFLRGMSAAAPLSGVFYDKPPRALIESLDTLFDIDLDEPKEQIIATAQSTQTAQPSQTDQMELKL